MTREEAIREVNKAFDYIEAEGRWATGFACVATHRTADGMQPKAVYSMAHVGGGEADIKQGVAGLTTYADPRLTTEPGVH